MNSVFLNYGVSYFDLLQGEIDNLFPSFGNDKMIISKNGKIAESKILSVSNRALLTTGENLLSIGDRSAPTQSENLTRIDIGYWQNGDIGYPDMRVDVFPHTKFYLGIVFEKKPINYHPGQATLWANNSGNLILENKEVCSGSGVNGNIPLFDSRPGTLRDSGLSLLSGSLTLELTRNTTLPGPTMPIIFNYTKIGKVVNLVIEKKLFQGSLIQDPGSFVSYEIGSFLPEFLRPVNLACSFTYIYQQYNTDQTHLINSQGFCTIDTDGTVIIGKDIADVEVFNADSGLNDGWPTFSISYTTN